MSWFAEQFGWMQWNVPTAIFFITLFVTLIGMAVWEGKRPGIRRKGFLPIDSTRGERLFLGIISSIGIFILWIAFFKGSLLLVPVILAVACFSILTRWG